MTEEALCRRWCLLKFSKRYPGFKPGDKCFCGAQLIRDIVLGIVGAFVGGWIFTAMGASGVTGIDIYSIFVAVIGAVVVLVAYHAIFRRRATA